MKLFIQTLLTLLLLITCVSCSDDPGNPVESGTIPVLDQPAVSDITATTARLTVTITDLGGSNTTDRGFCWSATSQTPGQEDNKIKVEGILKTFSAQISSLQNNTTYYVRAYATNSKGTAYSTVLSFTTVKELSEDEKLLEAYKPPTYQDDYTPIHLWNQRNQWNLANVHDPTVEKCGDYYYMYQTDASYGNVHVPYGHFHHRRSKDLVNWEYRGASMPDAPTWVKDSINNIRTRLNLPRIENPVYGYWAPIVRKAGNKYRMYYSIVVHHYIGNGLQDVAENFDNTWSERAFIGLMETDDLASNQWVDKGMVVCSSTDMEKNWFRPSLNNWSGYFKWNAIDPTFIITPEGTHWLIYGSWHSGFASLQLSPETGLPLNKLGESWDSEALPGYGKLIYTRQRNNRWQGSEAPEIMYNEETGYYYLFVAYDELSVRYNTRVLRSRNIDGPYLAYNGGDVTNGGEAYPILTHPYKFNEHHGWVGIAHCCVFHNDNGEWYYSSQARLPENLPGINASNALMMGHVRKIRWTDTGWPVVMPQRYGAVPDVKIKQSELVGTWENILIKYDPGKQNTSQEVILIADGKVTGALTGNWTWDADKKILTIGELKLCVEREVDWEANPRRHTLIYAGLNHSGESVWGKKIY